MRQWGMAGTTSQGRTGAAGGARPAAGLTLVELLITAAIVAVSLLAIVTIFPVAMSNIDVGAEETVALSVAQGFSEMVRGLDFNTLQQFNGFDTRKKTPCPATPVQVKTVCDGWVEQVTGNPAKGVRGLADGQATVTVTTQASANQNSAARLATVSISVSYAPRHAWLISPRRQVVLVTRKTEG